MGVDRQQALLVNIGMETLKAAAPLPEKLLLLQQNGIAKLADNWTPEEGDNPDDS